MFEQKLSLKSKLIKGEEGILVMDFIFAFMLLVGFSVMLFSISMTLTVTEVLQYMTFSSARVYAVADVSVQNSKQHALDKFYSLYEHPTIEPLFKNKWFEIEEAGPAIGDLSQDIAEELDRSTFHGVILPFTAKILDKNIPFIGSTNKSTEAGAFKTQVSSFLGIEPSQRDCQVFLQNRWQWLKEVGDYKIPTNSQENVKDYAQIADNGC